MELQVLLNGGQKGGAGALSGRAERNCGDFFVHRGDAGAPAKVQTGSVREGRQELQRLFKECRGKFQGRKELLMFRQEGQKEAVDAFSGRAEGSWRDSVREGRKRSRKGFCQEC